jgi:voltage-gated potassium channel
MFDGEVSFGNVIRGGLVMLLVVAAGTAWFAAVEGYSVLDAVYMTVITVSTVGFREVHDLDTSGRIFVVVLIISGLAVMTYTLGSIGQVIVEGSIQRYVGRQRMLRDIEKLHDHYVICGHGRMGQILCEELHSEGVPFVVVEGDPEAAEQLAARGYRVVGGDATEDDTLTRAGVKRAKGLVAVVSRDVDNLYITLSAREMCRESNPGLYILCRATDQSASEKIKRAGANRVISPYAIGGMRIVQALLRPTVYDFVDIATQRSGLDLMFEEIRIGAASRLDGVSVKDSDIRKHYDVIVIAIKKADGAMVFNPGPDTVMHGGDVLITLGDRGQLQRLASTLPA